MGGSHARRHARGAADDGPRRQHRPQARRVLGDEHRRQDVDVQAPRRPDVPHRQAGHREGRRRGPQPRPRGHGAAPVLVHAGQEHRGGAGQHDRRQVRQAVRDARRPLPPAVREHLRPGRREAGGQDLRHRGRRGHGPVQAHELRRRPGGHGRPLRGVRRHERPLLREPREGVPRRHQVGADRRAGQPHGRDRLGQRPRGQEPAADRSRDAQVQPGPDRRGDAGGRRGHLRPELREDRPRLRRPPRAPGDLARHRPREHRQGRPLRPRVAALRPVPQRLQVVRARRRGVQPVRRREGRSRCSTRPAGPRAATAPAPRTASR